MWYNCCITECYGGKKTSVSLLLATWRTLQAGLVKRRNALLDGRQILEELAKNAALLIKILILKLLLVISV